MAVLVVLALTAVAAGAQTVILNFDDIPTVRMPSGYGGLNWDNNFGIWGWPQDPYNPHSPPNRVLFNCVSEGIGESKATFIGSPQIFDGAWFTSDGSTVFLNLYNEGALVATSSVLVGSATPTFLSSGYSGLVDSVGIVGDRGYFAMDDFTYHIVPEPSALALLTFSLLIGGMRFRARLSPV